jgi:hypothetical protein
MSIAPQQKPNQPISAANITRKERVRLHQLGYKSADYNLMTREQIDAIIAAKTKKPGSAAYMNSSVNPLTGEPGDPLGGRYSDEAIEERNLNRPPPSGVSVTGDEFTRQAVKANIEAGQLAREGYQNPNLSSAYQGRDIPAHVITDEYTGRVVAGADQFDAVIIEYTEKNPGKRFRVINPNFPPTQGAEYQTVYDPKTRKPVEVAGGILGWMPEQIYQKSHVEPMRERSAAQNRQIAATGARESSVGTDAIDLGLSDEDAIYAPTKQPNFNAEVSPRRY